MSFGTIVIIIVAVIVLFQLRSVLGRRTGSERPPRDPYTRPEPRPGAEAKSGTVITLPSRREGTVEPVPAADAYAAIDKAVPPGEPLNADLRRVRDADPSFDPAGFLNGVRIAYEMIVTAFAEGDRKTLRNLLSQEAYSGFESVIAERERNGHKTKTAFIGVDEAQIVGAQAREREVLVTVRVVSQLITSVNDAAGAVVEGDPETVVEVRDVWTFARDTRSRDPNWKLVETEGGEA